MAGYPSGLNTGWLAEMEYSMIRLVCMCNTTADVIADKYVQETRPLWARTGRLSINLRRVLFRQHRLLADPGFGDFLCSAKKADRLDGRLDRLTCFVLLITQGVDLGLVETIPTVSPDHGLPCHGVLEFAVYAWTVRST